MTTYYVDPAGDDGNDGSEATPWATLEYAFNNISDGDTLELAAGTYDSIVHFQSGDSASISNITVNGPNKDIDPVTDLSGRGSEAIITNVWEQSPPNQAEFYGIKFQAGFRIAIEDVDDLVIEDCIFEISDYYGGGITYMGQGILTNATVKNCRFESDGNGLPGHGGIDINDMTVENCYFDCANRCISTDGWKNGIVKNCEFNVPSSGEDAVFLGNNFDGFTIEECTFNEPIGAGIRGWWEEGNTYANLTIRNNNFNLNAADANSSYPSAIDLMPITGNLTIEGNQISYQGTIPGSGSDTVNGIRFRGGPYGSVTIKDNTIAAPNVVSKNDLGTAGIHIVDDSPFASDGGDGKWGTASLDVSDNVISGFENGFLISNDDTLELSGAGSSGANGTYEYVYDGGWKYTKEDGSGWYIAWSWAESAWTIYDPSDTAMYKGSVEEGYTVLNGSSPAPEGETIVKQNETDALGDITINANNKIDCDRVNNLGYKIKVNNDSTLVSENKILG